MDVISNLFSYNRFFKRIEPLPLNPFRAFLPRSDSVYVIPDSPATVPVLVEVPASQYVTPF